MNQDELIEAMARIIDPSSWRVMDGYLAQMLRKYKGEHIGYDPDAFKHKESMAIARALIPIIRAHLEPTSEMVEAGIKSLDAYFDEIDECSRDYTQDAVIATFENMLHFTDWRCRMHTMEEMTRAGCTSRRGVRYWEDQGLLGDVERSDGGTRRYTAEQLDRARIIAAAQFGGFDLDMIKKMLGEYGPEVYEALMTRLADQARACVRLGENLPNPASTGQAPEYDL